MDKTWEEINEDMDATQMVDIFQKTNERLVDKAFPLKQIEVSSAGKPYFT